MIKKVFSLFISIVLLLTLCHVIFLQRLVRDRTDFGIKKMAEVEVLRGLLRLRRETKSLSDIIDISGISSIGFVGYNSVCQDIIRELVYHGIHPSFIICDDYNVEDFGIDIYHSKIAPDADLYICPDETDLLCEDIVLRNKGRVVILSKVLKGI